METTFVEPNSCSQNLESLFSEAINDSEFPQRFTVDARSALKGTVDDCYQMADDIGVEGIKKFEFMMNKFQSWCNKQRAQKHLGKEFCDDNISCSKNRRKHVPMTSGRYTSNVKRVINTHHM